MKQIDLKDWSDPQAMKLPRLTKQAFKLLCRHAIYSIDDARRKLEQKKKLTLDDKIRIATVRLAIVKLSAFAKYPIGRPKRRKNVKESLS